MATTASKQSVKEAKKFHFKQKFRGVISPPMLEDASLFKVRSERVLIKMPNWGKWEIGYQEGDNTQTLQWYWDLPEAGTIPVAVEFWHPLPDLND